MPISVEIVKPGKKGLLTPQVGDFCRINYDCYLLTSAKDGGRKVDSSKDKGKPFEFPVGIGACIPAFDEVVMKMTIGERVTFVCPPPMGYGEKGNGGAIPPNATLMFDVELVSVRQGRRGFGSDLCKDCCLQ